MKHGINFMSSASGIDKMTSALQSYSSSPHANKKDQYEGDTLQDQAPYSNANDAR